MKTSLLTEYLNNELKYISDIVLSISKDSDVGYLHSFRVSIRKVRSLLKLFFIEEKTIQKELKKIVKKTNTLRELDTFINSLDKEIYPKLYNSILEARLSYFKTVWTEKFVSDTIKRLKILTLKLQKIKCIYTKNEYIELSHNHYYESIRKFKNIKPSDSEEKLHKIRIHFKTSRYALEFLYKMNLSNEEKKIVKCKQTQEYFGEIQDKVNQIEWLKNLCSKLESNKECKLLIQFKKNELKELKTMKNKRV